MLTRKRALAFMLLVLLTTAILRTITSIAATYDEERRHNYTHKEIRGDRVSYFITDMNTGTETFTYYARATRDGVFTAMPTEAYAMYDLAMWGRSAGRVLWVKP